MQSNFVQLPTMYQFKCPNCQNEWKTIYTWQNIDLCWKCGCGATRTVLEPAYNVFD